MPNNNEELAAQALMHMGNMAFTGNQNKKNREFASSEAEKAYNRQIDFWNIVNDYNHPKNQMARFTEAGLNPNLIYGQMGSNTAAPAPEYKAARYEGKAPQIDPNFILTAARVQSEIAVNDQRIKNMEAQEEAVRANTILTNKKVDMQDVIKIAKELDIHYKYKDDGLVQTELRNKQLLTEKIKREIDLKIANANTAQSKAYWEAKKVKIFEELGINIDHSQHSLFGIINNLGRYGAKFILDSLRENPPEFPETDGNFDNRVFIHK